MDEIVVSNDELGLTEFNVLHREIMQCGMLASSYIYELGMKLKQMRDTKLYKQGGYEEFSDYVVDKIGIKARQAYKYISICENNTEEFLHSSAKLGVTKLALISNLDAEIKEDLVNSGQAESMTVKELKQTVKELNAELESSKSEIEQLSFDLEDYEKVNENLTNALNNAVAEAKAESKDKIDSLNAQTKKAIEEREKAIKELEKAKVDLEKSKKEIEKIKAEPPKTITIEDTESKQKLAEAVSRQAELEKEIVTLNKKIATSAPEILAFKIKFENWQKQSLELIDLAKSLNDDKYLGVIKKVIEGWKL